MSNQSKDKETAMDKALTTPVDAAVETAVADSKRKQGMLVDMADSVRLFWRLMRDRDVPLYLKAFPVAALVYLIWPLDLITDFAPFLGQLDDLTAILVSLRVFTSLAPAHVVEKHRAALRAARSISGDPEIEDAIKF